MPAPKGNANAKKSKKIDSHLTLRVTKEEKSAWEKAAYPARLSEWVRDKLNSAINARQDLSDGEV